jgi:hypothetical protein
MSNQPDWECIGQLGDVNPIDHGGYWILRDKTDVYPEEGELLVVPEDEDDEDGEYTIYRFILDRCTFINGVLSDNEHHPEHCAWWATTPEKMMERPQDGKGLSDVANCVGMDEEELVEDFCSEDALRRARAYQSVGNYHGFENLDSDPLRMKRWEVERRYESAKFKTPA